MHKPNTIELIRRYLFLHRLKNKTLSNTQAETPIFGILPNVPLSIAAYPPPQATTPTLIKLKPINKTTIPDTSGVITERKYLNVRLTIISTGEAAIQTPKTKGSPPVNPAVMIGPINEKLVPWIHSNLAPTGPNLRHWMNVETPEANNAIDTKNPVVSKSNFNALAIISGGVMIATKIASRCWRAANKASFKGGRSSIP